MKRVKSEALLKADSKTIQSILELTKSLLEKFKSRIPGTQGSLLAAGALAKIMRSFCDEVFKETFVLHPGSLFNIGRVISLAYILSVILLLLGGFFVYASLVLCVLSLFMLLLIIFSMVSFLTGYLKNKLDATRWEY